MKSLLFVLVAGWVGQGCGADSPLLDLKKYDFSIAAEMRFASKKNFTGHAVYSVPKCFLRKPLVEALSQLQSQLKLEGLGLKVYDCYRPLSVQSALWKQLPDSRFMDDPATSPAAVRGSSVDITLVDRLGRELDMGADYGSRAERALSDFKNLSPKAKKNRQRLRAGLVSAGFEPGKYWWHYQYKGWQSFPAENTALEDIK